MKRTAKLVTLFASTAIALTSCSIFGTEITEDEAIEQLTSMSKALEGKYGALDLDDNIPLDLQYLYVETKGYNNINGEKIEATNKTFFSMEKDGLYMAAINEGKSKELSSKEESYIVQVEDNKLMTWDVKDGVVGEVKENGLAALGFVLAYAMMLTMTTPDYGIQALSQGGSEGISFKKYNENTLDIKFSVPHERNLDEVYTKEVYTISYKDNLAKKLIREGIDEDGTKNMEMTMNFQFGSKRISKPTVPTKAA